jgi:hypothetical protein
VCPFDALADPDGDGPCAPDDLGLGDDSPGDTDGDLVCDDVDVCVGEDTSGDLDGDGHCALDVANEVHDCDERDDTIYPTAPELCDGIDNTCAGAVPAEEIDTDGDGFTICDGDCDDTTPDRSPEARELCNGLDDNCDDAPASWEADGDGDGTMGCADCDDEDPAIHPEAEEICDGIDNNCDEVLGLDEVDYDGDGTIACDDCDDDDDRLRADATELCEDGLDNDCDGGADDADEDCAACQGSASLVDTNSSPRAGALLLALIPAISLRRRRPTARQS